MMHRRNLFDLFETTFRKITKFINEILQHKLCTICLYYNTYNLALILHHVTYPKVHWYRYIYAPVGQGQRKLKRPKLIIQRS